MFRFLKNFKGIEWLFLFFIVLLNVGQVYLDLALPENMADIIALVLAKQPMNEVWLKGLQMLGMALGSIVALVICDYLASICASRYTQRMRGQIFGKVVGMSQGTINNFTTASLITRSTNDIAQVGNAISMGLKTIIYAPLLAIFALLKVIDKSQELSLVTGISIIALVLVVCVIFLFAVPRFKKVQKLTDSVNGINRENLSGLRVVRAFNAQDFQKEKFENTNESLRKQNDFVGKLMSSMSPLMSLVMNGLSLAIVWVGAHLISNGSLDIPTMTAFTMFAMQVVMGFLLLSVVFILVPRAVVSLKRIYEVLDAKENIADSESQSKEEKASDFILEFKDVEFKYPDAEECVLRNINFQVKAGQTVAFIGSTGSGKSTLINLIPRFYDVTKGEILLNCKNIKDYALTDLHSHFGYVPQKGVLFKGTVRSNIDFAKENLTDEQLETALQVSQSKAFVDKIGGLEAPIAQNGSNLSGGQKQRLSIARAVAKKPEILIFDDSFSALDYKTDKIVRKNLEIYLKDSTKFIVAQRIGTIKETDLIIVLDNGEMVGSGTHFELLKNCQVYQEIAESQLSKEEIYGKKEK